MERLVAIFSLLSNHAEPLIFLGAFFFGETVIITAAFLATQGVVSLEAVFLFSLAGTLVADIVWFYVGRSALTVTRRFAVYKEKYQGFLSVLERIYGTKPFLVLLFIKFLYGTRILTILYLSMRRMRLYVFLLFDFIGTALWLAAIIALGYFVGRSVGVEGVITSVQRAEMAVLLLLALFFAVRFGSAWITERFSNRDEPR